MKNLPTLKGIFPIETKPAKRDFVRENKIRLKDLQKQSINNNQITCCKQISSQQQYEQNELNANRRISPVTTKRNNSGCSCLSKKTYSSSKISSANQHVIRPHLTSNKPIYCDKKTQTDDISDEIFLSDALKRCISKDKVVSHDNLELLRNKPSINLENEDVDSTASHDNQGNQQSANEHYSESVVDINSNFHDTVDNIKRLENKLCNTHLRDSNELNKKLQTQFSHDFDNKKIRSNIKIPKYLEREKREKELQRIRELEKDPNCPKGHYVLDETERQETLKAAKEKFQKLVDELNRMPLTCQTLRLRNRKVEIEKSLTELEKTIQIFSKPKVYIREN